MENLHALEVIVVDGDVAPSIFPYIIVDRHLDLALLSSGDLITCLQWCTAVLFTVSITFTQSRKKPQLSYNHKLYIFDCPTFLGNKRI